MTSPNFPEIERLPGWIKEGVKDNFGNNPIIKIDDTITLDFFNASPDFDSSQTYSVWNFIKMRKVHYEKSMISNTEKIFRSFTEENIHYRRGLGLTIVKGQMENALKNPFIMLGDLRPSQSQKLAHEMRFSLTLINASPTPSTTDVR